jgi:hypothetical protein
MEDEYMREYQYKSYKRIHKFSNANDVEKGKISRETANYERYQKKARQISKKLEKKFAENNIETVIEENQKYEYAAHKEKKNAKGHKKRLKMLQSHEDFE